MPHTHSSRGPRRKQKRAYGRISLQSYKLFPYTSTLRTEGVRLAHPDLEVGRWSHVPFIQAGHGSRISHRKVRITGPADGPYTTLVSRWTCVPIRAGRPCSHGHLPPSLIQALEAGFRGWADGYGDRYGIGSEDAALRDSKRRLKKRCLFSLTIANDLTSNGERANGSVPRVSGGSGVSHPV